jgi:hypothetical protein
VSNSRRVGATEWYLEEGPVHRTFTALGTWAALALASSAGLAAAFLPFAFDVSAAQALRADAGGCDAWQRWAFVIVAWPLFTPLLVGASATLWLLRTWSGRERARRWERWVGYAVTAAVVTSTLWWSVGLTVGSDRQLGEWISDTWPAGVVYLLGGCLASRAGRSLRLRGLTPTLTLQAAYCGHTAFCLRAFSWDLQKGAYVALAAAMVYAGTAVLVTVRGRQRAASAPRILDASAVTFPSLSV